MKTEKEIREQLEQLEKELLHNANCMTIDSTHFGPSTKMFILMDAYEHDILLARICQLRGILNIKDKNN